MAPAIGMPLMRCMMLVWGSFLCQMRGFIDAIWDLIDRIMHSPIGGPTVSGRAVMIQAGLLSLLLAVIYATAR